MHGGKFKKKKISNEAESVSLQIISASYSSGFDRTWSGECVEEWVSVWNGECVEQWSRNGMLKWRTDKPSEDVICVVRLEILLLCCFATQIVGGRDYVDIPPYV